MRRALLLSFAAQMAAGLLPLAFLLRPWVAVALFNAVMILWHLPAPFDLGQNNQAVHIWLMHGSFFAAGVLFWLQFIPSPPFRRRMPDVSQAIALIGTNREFTLIRNWPITSGEVWSERTESTGGRQCLIGVGVALG